MHSGPPSRTSKNYDTPVGICPSWVRVGGVVKWPVDPHNDYLTGGLALAQAASLPLEQPAELSV